MSIPMNKRDLRQNAYIERAKSARGFARMLVPAAFIVLGTGIWKDPDLGPKLAEGLEVIRPTAASYLVDTPLEDLLGPATSDELVQQGNFGNEQLVVSNILPVTTDVASRN